MEIIPLNIIPKGVTYSVNCSKNDKNRVFRCELYDEQDKYYLSGSESLRVRYERPDKMVSSFGVVNTGSNYLDMEIPQELTEISGLVYCKLHIDSISAKGFYIKVEDSPRGEQ